MEKRYTGVKFSNENLFEALAQIMESNTAFYRKDFEIDKQIMHRFVRSDDPTEKTLLWLSRQCGTNCHLEREVFAKDSAAFISWGYHVDSHSEAPIAYVVELSESRGNQVYGNLYVLNYVPHAHHVNKNAVEYNALTLYLRDGAMKTIALDELKNIDYMRTPVYHSRPEPIDPQQLLAVLEQENNERKACKEGNLQAHIGFLRNSIYTNECDRIMSVLAQMDAPNSESGKNYEVQLAPSFVALTGGNGHDRLMDRLPFSEMHITTLKGRDGFYAFIGKEQVDAHRAKQRPSIAAAIKEGEEKAAAAALQAEKVPTDKSKKKEPVTPPKAKMER